MSELEEVTLFGMRFEDIGIELNLLFTPEVREAWEEVVEAWQDLRDSFKELYTTE